MKKSIVLFLIFIGLFLSFIFLNRRDISLVFIPTLQIPITVSTGALHFLERAKEQIGVVKTYDFGNGYYGNGGFPPSDTGVCSDIIWRAYRDMGYDFKGLLRANIQKNPTEYDGDMDFNINFRRVKRLFVYFSHTAETLTPALIPNDAKNLVEWQPGDIVIFDELATSHLWHIGIISDIRRTDGVPYMIDNHGQGVSITMTPLDWPTKVKGHFRIF